MKPLAAAIGWLLVAPVAGQLKWPSAESTADVVLERIAFGSCARQNRPQPVWNAIATLQPQAFLFLGDSIYADTTDMDAMRATYRDQFAGPEFQRFLATGAHVLATWDDHDYGKNDAGREYPMRTSAQQVFLDAFGVPADSPRRHREGVYHSQVFGPPGRRVQVLLLDTRYHRSPLKRGIPDDPDAGTPGRYVPDDSPEATMLGEAQWRWLAQQLEVPADVRLLCTSIQMVSTEHRFEHWGNLPRERERLLRLIAEKGAGGVIALSGDRHAGEISVLPPTSDSGTGPAYPLVEVTSSSLNTGRNWVNEHNRHRVSSLIFAPNFGSIEFDWTPGHRTVHLHLHGEDGTVIARHTVAVSELRGAPAAERTEGRELDTIGLVSCIKQDRPQPLWNDLAAREPDLCVLAGDNVYGDTEDMAVLRRRYDQLAADPDFAAFRRAVPLIATWDDHDYGRDDAGREYPRKRESAEIFLDFFGVPADSPRRRREGIYGSTVYGHPDRSVQVILLDTRTFRSPLIRRTVKVDPGSDRPGDYLPDPSPEATMMGEEQWQWLDRQLRVPARLRLLVSSIQALPTGHGWECWANLPRERQRLFDTIRRTRAGGVVLLSGDMHMGELSAASPADTGVPYRLVELTSSGLNQAWDFTNFRNDHRLGTVLWDPNYGLIEIDWSLRDPEIHLGAYRADGKGVEEVLRLSELQFP